MRPEPAVHALLRIGHARSLAGSGTLPAWAEAALEQAPWVVVRRARSRDGLLAVGVRGRGRAERLAAWLDPRAVLESLTPPQLAGQGGWRNSARRARIPALAALEAVAVLMDRHGLSWGPCGSVGFELATGSAAAGAESDLDLMIEAPTRLPRAAAAAIHAGLARLPVRADVQLEGPMGAVALAEYALAGAPVILRTVDGPRLVEDAWSGAAAAA